MLEVYFSDGYNSLLNVEIAPLIIDVETYEIHSAANEWIYNKLLSSDWKSLDSSKNAAYSLVHYLNWLEEHSLSQGEHPSWDLATNEDLTTYFNQQIQSYIDNEKMIAGTMINARMDTVIQFYRWCNDKGKDHCMDLDTISTTGKYEADKDDNLLSHKDSFTQFAYITHKLKVRTVTRPMIKFILSPAEFASACASFTDIAYLICAMLYYFCGLRRSEVIEYLTLDSSMNPELQSKNDLIKSGVICIEEGKTIIKKAFIDYHFIGKGRKIRTVEMPTLLWVSILDNYLPLRAEREKKFSTRMENDATKQKENNGIYTKRLLITKNGYLLTREAISTAFARAQKKSGIKFHPHMLRHTFATDFIAKYHETHPTESHMIEFNIVIHEELKKMLGHIKVSTTMLYIHVTNLLRNSDLLESFRPKFNVQHNDLISNIATLNTKNCA